MKSRAIILTMLFVVLVTASTVIGEIIYVDDDANGANDGSSWASAFNYLQDALRAAWPGDEIRVAQGIYNPTYHCLPPMPPSQPPPSIDPLACTFRLISGVAIKGGYAGFGGTDPNARDIKLYETILSGDLFGNDREVNDPGDLLNDPCRADNNYHIVTGKGTNETAVLDGFTITGGNANRSREYFRADRGGGMFNDEGSPTVTNCTFRDNAAKYYGGGMYNGGDNSNPMVTNCTFKGNWTYYGGAVCNSNKSKPTLANCAFITNTANHDGGGMYDEYSSPMLTNCTFNSNWAGSGGGMCNIYSSPTLSFCTFSGNSSLGGGGMVNANSNPTLTNCMFSKNTADRGLISDGGGVASYSSSPTLAICIFNENSAAHSGGGIFSYGGSPRLSNCVFRGNLAEWDGGGMYNEENNPTLNDCTFNVNSAGMSGGGVCNWYNNPTIVNCTFIKNSVGSLENVDAQGGGMSNISANVKVTNCIFSGNSAESMFGGDGGGVSFGPGYNALSQSITNCTFTGNTAKGHGGGIYVVSIPPFPGRITDRYIFNNFIIWGNRDSTGYDESAQINLSGQSLVNYSCIQGWTGTLEGIGNIDADPLFVEPGYWDTNSTWIEGDYHLLEDSPCIDTGDPNYVAGPNETDLDGKPRVIGGRIDMGAYEYSPPIPAEIKIVPRTINLQSKGEWITGFIQMPEDYDMNDIDANSVYLEGEIKPEQFWLAEDNQIAIARFSREEVQAFLTTGEVELTITGQLKDGTLFERTDVIRVIGKGRSKNLEYRIENYGRQIWFARIVYRCGACAVIIYL